MTSSHESRKHPLLVVALATLLALVAAPSLLATGNNGGGGNGGPKLDNRCTVKFVCGAPLPLSQDGGRVVEGSYRTSINILNTSGKTVNYKKKLVFTTPCDDEGDPQEEETFENEGGISETFMDSLSSPAAFDVDCREVFGEFHQGPPGPPTPTTPTCGPFSEGFLLLESDGSLQVTAVYTAGGGEGGASIDVESVKCSGDDDDKDDHDDH